jgi:hypothetical protein
MPSVNCMVMMPLHIQPPKLGSGVQFFSRWRVRNDGPGYRRIQAEKSPIRCPGEHGTCPPSIWITTIQIPL